MKKLIPALVVCILLTAIAGPILQEKEESLKNKSTSELNSSVQNKTSFSEPLYTELQLYNNSDLIVIAELGPIKTKEIRTITTKAEPDSPAATYNHDTVIVCGVRIYDLKVTEVVKGEIKTRTVELVVPDISTPSFKGLIEGKTYKFHLTGHEYEQHKAYNLLSFSQGYQLID